MSIADLQRPMSHRSQLVDYEIPAPLKQEHEALHDQLRQATQAGGEVGANSPRPWRG